MSKRSIVVITSKEEWDEPKVIFIAHQPNDTEDEMLEAAVKQEGWGSLEEFEDDVEQGLYHHEIHAIN